MNHLIFSLRTMYNIPSINKWMVIIGPLVAMLSLPSINNSFADDLNPNVFGTDESPYGKKYADWTQEWWKWVISFPTDKSPVFDETGEKCDSDQPKDVFYLTGTGGGFKEVKCKVPEGKALFFPAYTGECSYKENEAIKTEEGLHDCAKSDEDNIDGRVLKATIDGVPISDLIKYRVHSGVFNVTFPEKNMFGRSEGPTQAVSDGYWVFLKPLEKGPHLIEFSGGLIGCTINNNCQIESAKYHIEVG